MLFEDNRRPIFTCRGGIEKEFVLVNSRRFVPVVAVSCLNENCPRLQVYLK